MSQRRILWRTITTTSPIQLIDRDGHDAQEIAPGRYKVKITTREITEGNQNKTKTIAWAEFKHVRGRIILGGISAGSLLWHISTEYRDKAKVETTEVIRYHIEEDKEAVEERIRA